MCEVYEVNGKVYRAYPTRWFCDGVEITFKEYAAAVNAGIQQEHQERLDREFDFSVWLCREQDARIFKQKGIEDVPLYWGNRFDMLSA